MYGRLKPVVLKALASNAGIVEADKHRTSPFIFKTTATQFLARLGFDVCPKVNDQLSVTLYKSLLDHWWTKQLPSGSCLFMGIGSNFGDRMPFLASNSCGLGMRCRNGNPLWHAVVDFLPLYPHFTYNIFNKTKHHISCFHEQINKTNKIKKQFLQINSCVHLCVHSIH